MGKVILIVEDDQKSLKLIRELLQISGYTTLEAINGELGVKLARAKKPDLILMDIQLPIMDGYEATRILKSDTSTKNIPVLALTAYAMSGDEEKTLQAGCEGYFTKPINTREFLEKIAEYLSSS